MPSLADLFNPSFLMFLGILVLVAALLVVYFESKLREQNHKITSMFSLVSSLAEEVNGIKFNLTQISLQQNAGFLNNDEKDLFFEQISGNRPSSVFRKNENEINNPNLISVSDDDSDIGSDDETDNNDDLESIDSSESSNHDEEKINLSHDNHNDVKILKLNIQSSKNILKDDMDNLNLDYHNDNDESEDLEDLENLEDFENIDDDDEINNEQIDSQSVSSKESEKLLEDEFENLENQLNENSNSELINNSNVLEISSSDFKTININLEEPITEHIDYKKLSIPKLRSIVAEKNLSNDTSKLKKPELLKLLGVE
jgi:hypothetical protein